MQSVSFRIWTRVTSYDDTHYTMGTSTRFNLIDTDSFLDKKKTHLFSVGMDAFLLFFCFNDILNFVGYLIT